MIHSANEDSPVKALSSLDILSSVIVSLLVLLSRNNVVSARGYMDVGGEYAGWPFANSNGGAVTLGSIASE